MQVFIKDFPFSSAGYSADFKKGDPAPIAYPEIMNAVKAALSKETNAPDNGNAPGDTDKVEG
jgi:hypothetical protein